MQSRFFFASAAGLVSGLLFVAATRGQVASLMMLVFLMPLPIAITGFCWGWIAAAIAALTAFGFLTIVGSITAGLFHLGLFGGPAVVAIYFLMLSRPATSAYGRDTVEWYPVGHVLFWVAMASGVIATAALFALGTSTSDLHNHVTKIVEKMAAADLPWPGGKKPDPDELKKLITYMTLSFSGAIALSWIWITIFNLWIGAKVARASGLLERPWPNISLTALPGWAGLPLAAALAGSFMTDYPGHIASGFATGLFLAFLLVGLAIAHNVTWKNPFRPALLAALYVFLLFLNPLSSLAIATLALVERFMPMRNPYHGGLLTRDPPDDTDT